MNIGKMGLVLFVLGLLLAAGAGIHRLSLERSAQQAGADAVLTYDSFGSLKSSNAQSRARQLRQQRDAMNPWIIGGAVGGLLGVGMIFAGGGNADTIRTCPKCAEDIKAAAVVCKHCRTELQPMDADPSSAPIHAGRRESRNSYQALAAAAEEAERRAGRS